jgi:hypothetical protein
MLKKIVLTLMIVSAGGQLSLIACEKTETKVRTISNNKSSFLTPFLSKKELTANDLRTLNEWAKNMQMKLLRYKTNSNVLEIS